MQGWKELRKEKKNQQIKELSFPLKCSRLEFWKGGSKYQNVSHQESFPPNNDKLGTENKKVEYGASSTASPFSATPATKGGDVLSYFEFPIAISIPHHIPNPRGLLRFLIPISRGL